MIKFLFFTLLLLAGLSGSVSANHIVGGEFEILHLGGNLYQINLIQYRDELQSANTVIEAFVEPRIFRKRGNKQMQDIVLNYKGESIVEYTSEDECAGEYLLTKKVVYSAEIYLDPEEYDDEGGYYIAWERCCRNNSIDNVVQAGDNTIGQTYYLEFPPIVLHDDEFINNSPHSFLPLSDYACVGKPFIADFTGKEKDGDQLVYSLAPPLDSSTDDALPAVTPAPYPVIRMKKGFETIIPGSPGLKISKNGILTVTPSHVGLYVFSVRVEEFRKGLKIGEVRRDFQLLVIDCAPKGPAPDIIFDVPEQGNFDPLRNVVFLSNEISQAEKCVEVVLTDQENLAITSLKVTPVNFQNENNKIVYTVSNGQLNETGDTVRYFICFNECLKMSEPYALDISAILDTCPGTVENTTRLTVTVEPPDNANPYFLSAKNIYKQQVYAGGAFELPLEIKDRDGDFLDLTLVPMDFDTAGLGMRLTTSVSEPGLLRANYTWETACGSFNLEEENIFTLKFVANDMNDCSLGEADTLTLALNIEDIPADFDEFSIPNVFTPNGDGKNDFFQMCQTADCDDTFTLPPDNCEGKFLEVVVFNRWGKKVFISRSRDFKWDGADLPTGSYFYVLKYSHREFKSPLSLLR